MGWDSHEMIGGSGSCCAVDDAEGVFGTVFEICIYMKNMDNDN